MAVKVRCIACGHPKEQGGIEPRLYPVGQGVEVCSWCLKYLKRRGFARIGTLSANRWVGMILLPDGSIIRESEFKEEGKEWRKEN